MGDYITREGRVFSQTCVSLEKSLKESAKERKISLSALLTRALKAELGELAA